MFFCGEKRYYSDLELTKFVVDRLSRLDSMIPMLSSGQCRITSFSASATGCGWWDCHVASISKHAKLQLLIDEKKINDKKILLLLW